MPTYYEILGVAPGANTAEIETAYEKQYNQFRRLVTHHDPEVAGKANEALHWLEKARTTLANPDTRSAYDAGIGVNSVVGGLADLQASALVTIPASPLPPSPSVVSQTSPVLAGRADAWICSKCGKHNAEGTRFCKECGNQIGVECVDCGTMMEAEAQFCPTCGVNISEAIHLKEIAEAERLKREQERIRREAEEEARREAEEKRLSQLKVGVGIMGAIVGAISAPLAWNAIWPAMMEHTCCAWGQVALGATGGAIASVWAGGGVGSHSSEAGFIVGFITAILGGILAFPIVVLAIVLGVLGVL